MQLNSKGPVSSEARVRLLRTLGYRVLSDINEVSVVMPTALIGTVLLTLRGRGVGKAELVRRVEWLSDRVRAKGGRVAHFAGTPTSVVVDRGLEVLGPELIGVVDGLPEETYYAVDRFQLSFYRNMTIHLFISEALVSAAMYTRVKQGGGPDNQRITYEALLNQVSFLSQVSLPGLLGNSIMANGQSQLQLFRGEFIFPTEGLTVNLEKTLQGLEGDDVIAVTRDPASKISAVELSNAERACGRENYDFYCFLIWPFIEASWLGAVSLMGLTPPVDQKGDVWLELIQTQDKAQLVRGQQCPRIRGHTDAHNTVGQNALPPRRPLLLRSRQQRNAQKRLPALRRRKHRPPLQKQRLPHPHNRQARPGLDPESRSRHWSYPACGQALGFHRDDRSVETRRVIGILSPPPLNRPSSW